MLHGTECNVKSFLYVVEHEQFSIFNNHESKTGKSGGCTHITWINWFLRENYRVCNSDCFARRLPRWNLASFSPILGWWLWSNMMQERRELMWWSESRKQEIETRNSFSSSTIDTTPDDQIEVTEIKRLKRYILARRLPNGHTGTWIATLWALERLRIYKFNCYACRDVFWSIFWSDIAPHVVFMSSKRRTLMFDHLQFMQFSRILAFMMMIVISTYGPWKHKIFEKSWCEWSERWW